jgi:hypothetical protein
VGKIEDPNAEVLTVTRRTLAGRLILAGAIAALPATASPITFTISQQAVSGSLNGVPFSAELVTFTQTTDTTLISSASCGFPCAPAVTTNTVTIQGVGTETLTGTSFFFDNGINVFGITNALGSAFLGAEDVPPFDTYNMKTAFGPTAYPFFGGSSVVNVATSGGPLSISWNGNSQPTAQACLAGTCSQSSTPEPGSLGLALLGVVPLATRLLRRRFLARY